MMSVSYVRQAGCETTRVPSFVQVSEIVTLVGLRDRLSYKGRWGVYIE